MPLIVTAAPAMPLAGVNPVIVGAPPFVPTVKFELLVAGSSAAEVSRQTPKCVAYVQLNSSVIVAHAKIFF